MNEDTRRNRREFLCDFAWVRWQKSHPMWIEKLVLAAESEWNPRPGSVAYDFRKLIPLRASMKLCVYQVIKQDSEERGENFREGIANALQSYKDHRRGDCYFLLELHRVDEALRLYYWCAQIDGHVPRVDFRAFR
jgi:hypothetical protein